MKIKFYIQLIVCLSLSISLKGQTASEHFNNGITKYNNKDYQGATKDFTEAININPKNADFYIYRAKSLDDLGRCQEAIQDYKKAINIHSNDALVGKKLVKIKSDLTYERTPKIWIVTVGIDNYKYIALLSTLRASVSNVYNFNNIFLLKNLTTQEQVETLSNQKANKQNILAAIQNKLCDKNLVYPKDMIVFYFVGHGFAIENSFGICPYDFLNMNQLISEKEIVDLLQTSPARHKFCFIEAGMSENKTIGARVSGESLKLFNQTKEQSGNSLTIMTSTQVGEPSIEDEILGGIFSHFFQIGLKGKADGYPSGKKDNIITTRELYNYVTDNVRKQTSGIQKPQINKVAYEADIPIIPVIERDR